MSPRSLLSICQERDRERARGRREGESRKRWRGEIDADVCMCFYVYFFNQFNGIVLCLWATIKNMNKFNSGKAHNLVGISMCALSSCQQVDLHTLKVLTGIATQGAISKETQKSYHVTTFKLEVSTNGEDWMVYRHGKNHKVGWGSCLNTHSPRSTQALLL